MKSTLNADRLKKRIDELAKRNIELQEEVRVLEAERAEATLLKEKRGRHTVAAGKFADQLVAKQGSSSRAAPLVEQDKAATSVAEATKLANAHTMYPSAMRMNVKLRTSSKQVSENRRQDGRIERRMADGTKVTYFPDGNVKELSPDGCTTTHLENGDVKEVVQYRQSVLCCNLRL